MSNFSFEGVWPELNGRGLKTKFDPDFSATCLPQTAHSVFCSIVKIMKPRVTAMGSEAAVSKRPLLDIMVLCNCRVKHERSPDSGEHEGLMIKVGRNESCPCGSGKKFKKCHGDLARLDRVTSAISAAPVMLARHEAAEQQRIEQQGLGKPIISARMDNGHQFVAVRNRLLYSKKWKTFHDFLGDYLKGALGTEWGNAELCKPFDQRHPILVWYHKLCE